MSGPCRWSASKIESDKSKCVPSAYNSLSLPCATAANCSGPRLRLSFTSPFSDPPISLAFARILVQKPGMSAESVARWNAIPLNRPEPDETPYASLKVFFVHSSHPEYPLHTSFPSLRYPATAGRSQWRRRQRRQCLSCLPYPIPASPRCDGRRQVRRILY